MSDSPSPWLTRPIEPLEVQPSPGGSQAPYAGFGVRAMAYSADALFLILLTVPIQLAFGEGAQEPGSIATFISLVLSLTYQGYLPTTRWQGTPGKRLFHLKIETLDGQRINGLTSLKRLSLAIALQILVIIAPVKVEPGVAPDLATGLEMLLVILVSGLDVGLVLTRSDKRALHDLIAGTCVRRYPSEQEDD